MLLASVTFILIFGFAVASDAMRPRRMLDVEPRSRFLNIRRSGERGTPSRGRGHLAMVLRRGYSRIAQYSMNGFELRHEIAVPEGA